VQGGTWLCDEWQTDVLTDTTGKMVVISLALTLIQRLLLAMRPAFLISAGLRGGGKTTLCHMLMMAVFDRMAAAALLVREPGRAPQVAVRALSAGCCLAGMGQHQERRRDHLS
jgi:hypothetical protein